MRKCGQCSMCCKVLDIKGLAKPGVQCPHVVPGLDQGCCSMHGHHPLACSSFDCLWRQSDVLGRDLRPDRCGVMFEADHDNRFVIANVSSDKLDAPTNGAPKALLYQILKDGYFVWIMAGKDRHLILPKRVSEKQAIAITKAAWKRKMRATT